MMPETYSSFRHNPTSLTTKRPTTMASRFTALLLRPRLFGAVAALLLGSIAAPARADLIITVLDSSAAPGGTGTFDITLTNTGAVDINIGTFSVEPTLSPTSGVHFTDVTTATTLPYIFAASSSVTASSPFSYDLFPNTDFTASDSSFSTLGYETIAAGATLGLAHVLYSVDAGTPLGTAPVRLNLTGTALDDGAGNFLTFTPVNGTITIALRAVPEPSTVLLMGIGGGLLFLRRKGTSITA